MGDTEVDTFDRRIVVLGARLVGKSQLVFQFVGENPSHEYNPGIEHSFRKSIHYKGIDYNCEIVVAPGLDDFSTFDPRYATGTHGYVLVYSVTSRHSFEMIQSVHDDIVDSNGVTDIPCVIVSTMRGVFPSRKVEVNEGKRLALSVKAAWLEINTTHDVDIAKVFELCLVQIENNTVFKPKLYTHPRFDDPSEPANLLLETEPVVAIPPYEAISEEVQEDLEVPDLTGLITRLKEFASAHGGFADVWEATWGDAKVAVKVLRPPSEDEESKMRLKRRLRREFAVWRRLDHKNILPLIGVTTNFGPHFSMVCPWMENGMLNTYLERSKTSLTLTDKFKLLHQIAEGLSYLHSRDVIHGDLTGSNILIDEKGTALLSDFGLSTVIAEFQGTSYLTSNIRGAVRYAAPEIYKLSDTAMYSTANSGSSDTAIPSSGNMSNSSDVYSFGCVMLQTLSCRIPYHYLRNDAAVLLEVHSGKPHQRPSEPWFTNGYWEFIVRCWDRTPQQRPTTREVVEYIDQHLYMDSFA